MNKRVGRPKRTDVTKRIHCVLPDEVLSKLDDKIKSLHDSKIDRSKAITESLKSWLGISNSRRNFENIYAKLGNPFNKDILNNLDDFASYIINKLISNEPLNDEDILKINDLFSKQKININKDLEIKEEIVSAFILEQLLFLSRLYPISNYLGKCQYCGEIFFKKRIDQKFDTTACNIRYYKKLSEKSSDNVKIYADLNKAIEDLKEKIDLDSVELTDYLNKKNRNDDIILTLKNILNDICLECGYSFSKLKKLFKKNWNTDLYEFILHLERAYELYLSYRYPNMEEMEKINLDTWAKDTAQVFFPITKNIRYHFESWLKTYISPLYFAKVKSILLAKREILKYNFGTPEYFIAKNSLKKAFIDCIEYYEKNYEIEKGNSAEVQINKNVKIIRLNHSILRENLIDKNTNIEETISCCNKILDVYPNDIDARCLIIITYFKNYCSQPCEELLNELNSKIIYQYEKIQETISKKAVGRSYKNKNNSFSSIEDELLATSQFEDIYVLVENCACIAYFFNKDFTKFEDLAKKIVYNIEVDKKEILNYFNKLKEKPILINFLLNNIFLSGSFTISMIIYILKSIWENNLEKTIEITKENILYVEKCLDAIIDYIGVVDKMLANIDQNLLDTFPSSKSLPNVYNVVKNYRNSINMDSIIQFVTKLFYDVNNKFKTN